MIYKKYIKRAIDFLIALLLCPPVALITAVFGTLVILDDGRPAFYNSERRGKNGEVFKMYKLRSMKNNSPDIRMPDGATYNSENDPRVFKAGKIIRKFSIDELPQIFNVLKGDMSFVGPRPSIVSMDYNDLDPDRKKRLEVLPGITGYSQAYFRNSISQEEKIKRDCWYVDHISFLVDLKIIAKTAASVLKKKNIFNN